MTKELHVDTAIIGAGIAGLGAAHRLEKLEKNYTIFEARSSAGGLLDNFTIDGYRFDHAVHLSFAKEAEVRSIFDLTPYYKHKPVSKCFDEGYWLKHPVQNNLWPLETDLKVKLIKSFLDRPDIKKIKNYKEWLLHQYGEFIAERYPLRYTRKYWDTDAQMLSTEWVGNRMRRANLDEILKGALQQDTPNHYYTNEMRYPKIGGYKSFIQPLIDTAKIKYDYQCKEIFPDQKTITFSNGDTVKYSKLISTIPLPELVSKSIGTPDEVHAASRKLKATSIDLVSIGFNKHIETDLWFYIYDDDIFASRAYSPSMKSPDNAPEGCSSLQFEIYTRGVESKFKAGELIDNVKFALRKMNIAKVDDIAVIDHRRVKYGNVIFDIGMHENRKKILEWCAAKSIVTCGRFGAWDYLWSNQSFMSGWNAVGEA